MNAKEFTLAGVGGEYLAMRRQSVPETVTKVSAHHDVCPDDFGVRS
jgi:hypothetical protein